MDDQLIEVCGTKEHTSDSEIVGSIKCFNHRQHVQTKMAHLQ
jgi:hypothetical protein